MYLTTGFRLRCDWREVRRLVGAGISRFDLFIAVMVTSPFLWTLGTVCNLSALAGRCCYSLCLSNRYPSWLDRRAWSHRWWLQRSCRYCLGLWRNCNKPCFRCIVLRQEGSLLRYTGSRLRSGASKRRCREWYDRWRDLHSVWQLGIWPRIINTYWCRRWVV
jgi:hypothetical protein